MNLPGDNRHYSLFRGNGGRLLLRQRAVAFVMVSAAATTQEQTGYTNDQQRDPTILHHGISPQKEF
jgi:hypothetical protein